MHEGWGSAVIETPQLDDDTFVERAARGDRNAFEELYRRHVGRIHSYLIYTTQTREDAEELTQEVFVQAWRKLGQFRRESTLGTWLMAIAVSTARMWYRRRSRRVREIAEGELRNGEIEIGGAKSDQTCRAADLLDLKRAIAALPRRARSVLVLHELQGYQHAEIARVMGIAVGTSKAQLSRARRLLAEALQDG